MLTIIHISYSLGGLQGGTLLHIYGANFLQSGLSSSHTVYIGDSLCPVIEYYSTDSVLVCTVPKCSATECLTTINFQGMVTVDVNVYIQTVETELGASSSFTYAYNETPFITNMDHTVWATSTSSVTGKMISSTLTDYTIKIDGQFSDVGEPGDLNPGTIDTSLNTENTIYYHSPTDMVGGFRNLSLYVQDSTNITTGPGLADMFTEYYPLALMTDLTHTGNYDSTIIGTSFSVCVLPTISTVSTKQGSVSGGTELIIKGHGFNSDSIVYAGGELCPIKSVSVDSLICITSPHHSTLTNDISTLNKLSDTIKYGGKSSSDTWILNSTRHYGSAGAWLKLWKRNDPKYGKDSSALLSVPWREGSLISMSNNYGATWNTNIGLNSTTTSISFDAEMRTILSIPLTGNYSFYLSADDYATLYDSNNHILARVTSPQLAYDFWKQSSQISKSVYLKRGDKYSLRLTSVSIGVFVSV